MPITLDIEIQIMFATAVFFTYLFLRTKERGFQLFFGGLTTISWIIFGLIYMATNSTFSVLGLLFAIIGICFGFFDVALAFQKPTQTDVEEE